MSGLGRGCGCCIWRGQGWRRRTGRGRLFWWGGGGARVVGDERIGERLWLLHLEAPEIAKATRAGQFVLVRCAEVDVPVWDPFLPRAFFVFGVDRAAGR